MLRFCDITFPTFLSFHMLYGVFSFFVLFFVPTKYVAIYKVSTYGYSYDAQNKNVLNAVQTIHSRYAFIDSHAFKETAYLSCVNNSSRPRSVPTEFRASLEPNLTLITLEVSAASLELARRCLHEYYLQVFNYYVEQSNTIRNNLELDRKYHMRQIKEYDQILTGYVKRCLSDSNRLRDYIDDYCFSGYASYLSFRTKIDAERNALNKIHEMLQAVNVTYKFEDDLVFVQTIGTISQLALLLAVLYLLLVLAFTRFNCSKSSK